MTDEPEPETQPQPQPQPQPQSEPETPSPVEAFEDLRREVAFMRRAIERMSDEQRAAPDYSETLAQMTTALTRMAQVLAWLKRQPAVTTTPQDMAAQIRTAGDAARATDRRTIETATDALRETQRQLAGVVLSARQAEDQERQLCWAACIATTTGLVLGMLLLIAVARLMPEHSAAWIMGMDHQQEAERSERLLPGQRP